MRKTAEKHPCGGNSNIDVFHINVIKLPTLDEFKHKFHTLPWACSQISQRFEIIKWKNRINSKREITM